MLVNYRKTTWSVDQEDADQLLLGAAGGSRFRLGREERDDEGFINQITLYGDGRTLNSLIVSSTVPGTVTLEFRGGSETECMSLLDNFDDAIRRLIESRVTPTWSHGGVDQEGAEIDVSTPAVAARIVVPAAEDCHPPLVAKDSVAQLSWLTASGERTEAGEAIAELHFKLCVVTMSATASGALRHIKNAGSEVVAGDMIGQIESTSRAIALETGGSRLPASALRQLLKDAGRDLSRCGNCGYSAKTEIHHIVPLSRGGTNSPGNLAVLCPNCHGLIHGTRDQG